MWDNDIFIVECYVCGVLFPDRMVRLSEFSFTSVQKFVTSLSLTFLFTVSGRFHCCTHSRGIKLNFGRPTFKITRAEN